MTDYWRILLDNTSEAAQSAALLHARLQLPETAADSRLYLHLSKEAQRLAPYAEAHNRLQQAVEALAANRKEQQTAESEWLTLLREEEARLVQEATRCADRLQALTGYMAHGGNAPCQLTVRGVNGNEFAHNVLRLYEHYLDETGLAYTVQITPEGGAIDVGAGGFGRLRYEAGTHKRSDGAACTVAVMPVAPKGKVEILPEEIRVDIFCSTGKGGQNVNKVETAVRITHLPTGTVVTCQDERSQLMNKRRALSTLQQRLQEAQDKQTRQDYVQRRDSQVQDRSNAVRRYDQVKGLLRDTRTEAQVPLAEGMRGHIEPLIRAAVLKYRQ